MKRILIALVLLLALTICGHAEDAARLENKPYRFAFTFQPGTELAYEEDGVGFKGSHMPEGSQTPDYGILVYGSPAMQLSAGEAKAAKLGKAALMLQAKDVADDKKWTAIFSAIMTARGDKHAGDAQVKSGKTSVSVPYYTWEQTLGGHTHHALMYVVKHGDAFIYVQVESNNGLSKAQEAWMASKLELLAN